MPAARSPAPPRWIRRSPILPLLDAIHILDVPQRGDAGVAYSSARRVRVVGGAGSDGISPIIPKGSPNGADGRLFDSFQERSRAVPGMERMVPEPDPRR